MKWKQMEELVDTGLMESFSSMIFLLSEMKGKDTAYREKKEKSMFGDYLVATPRMSLEEEYSLRYPGEVLERRKEKMGDSSMIMRTLAVTLAVMKDFLEPEMFVGNQFGDFFKAVQRAADSDLYLTGMLYTLEEQPLKKLEWESRMEAFTPADVLQVLYLMEISGERTGKRYRMELAGMLGSGRSFSVYDNPGLYGTVIRLAGCDGKCGPKEERMLKAICRLPQVNTDQKNPVKKWLMEAGYDEDEIRFLNAYLIFESDLAGRMYWQSITAERVALACCSHFLGGKSEKPAPVYELCRELLYLYREYQIQLEGKKGIIQSLQGAVMPQNIASFMVLYETENVKEKASGFFRVNLIQERWQALPGYIGKEAYDDLFCDVIFDNPFPENSLCDYLDFYQGLTGQDFRGLFWEKRCVPYPQVFSRMAAENCLDLHALAEEFFEDSSRLSDGERERKWENMLANMKNSAFSLNTQESFEILRMADERFGIAWLGEKIGDNDFPARCFGMRTYSDDLENLVLSRENFTRKENAQVLGWAEQYVYQRRPKLYIWFLLRVLLSGETEFLDAEEAKLCARMLIDSQEIYASGKEALREKYYSEQEKERYRQQQAEQEEIRKRLERQRKMQKEEAEFRELQERYGELSPERLRDFLMFKYGAEKEAAAGLVRDYVVSRYFGGKAATFKRKAAGDFLCLLAELYYGGGMALGDVKDYVEKMEEEQE